MEYNECLKCGNKTPIWDLNPAGTCNCTEADISPKEHQNWLKTSRGVLAVESEKIEQIRAVLEAWEQATEGSTGKDVFNKIGGICFDAEADISDLEADVYAELQSDYTNIDFANDTIQDIVEHLNK